MNMTMSIDEVSVMLGELKADAKTSQNQRSSLFAKIEETSTQLSELTTLVKTSVIASEARLVSIEKTTESQGVTILSLVKLKHKFYVGLAAATGGSGTIGAIIADWLNSGTPPTH